MPSALPDATPDAMPGVEPDARPHVLIVGTGGTIAGRAASATDTLGYTAGAVGVQALVEAVPALAGVPLRTLQLAQVDSKDMGPALWQALVGCLHEALAREDVAGIVVTHGTDTLEETAFLLQRVLAPAKPVVLTAAMRPASALQADGPQNLLDAVGLAQTPGAQGVLVVMAGQVHAADSVRKAQVWALDALDSAPAGPLAQCIDGRLRWWRPCPAPQPDETARAGRQRVALLARPVADWPRVAWITSHAGFDGALVDAAVAAGFDGLVLAGTGNGTLHHALEAAAARAQAAGLALCLSTRCAGGRVLGELARALPVSDTASPAQARVALLLDLLERPTGGMAG